MTDFSSLFLFSRTPYDNKCLSWQRGRIDLRYIRDSVVSLTKGTNRNRQKQGEMEAGRLNLRLEEEFGRYA